MGGKVNFKSLVAELKAHIEQQEKMIDANNNKIEAIRRQQNLTTMAVDNANNPNKGGGNDQVAQTRMVKVQREVVNDDGEVEKNDEYKASEVDDESAQAVMEVLDDETKELLSSFSDNFQQMVASQKLQSDKHGVQALQTITQEENEEAMRLALEQYSKLTA